MDNVAEMKLVKIDSDLRHLTEKIEQMREEADKNRKEIQEETRAYREKQITLLESMAALLERQKGQEQEVMLLRKESVRGDEQLAKEMHEMRMQLYRFAMIVGALAAGAGATTAEIVKLVF